MNSGQMAKLMMIGPWENSLNEMDFMAQIIEN